MGKFSLFWLLFLFAATTFASVEINEVMYDPNQCQDKYCEWIELYNSDNESINVSECFLDGKKLEGSIENKSFLLIARKLNNFTFYFGERENILERSLSFKNSADIINLTCNGSEILFEYNSSFGGDGNGRTLERNGEGGWEESLIEGGTPGEKNSVYDCSVDYSILKINEIMPDPFGEDGADKPLGEWVEIYNSGNKPINLEKFVIKDEDDEHEIYLAQNKVLSSLLIEPGSYLVVYRDGDSDFSLNNYGYDEVRLFAEEELIDKVSYTGSTEGMSWSKIQEAWFQTIPTPGEENFYQENCDWQTNLEISNSIFQKDDFDFDLVVKRNYGFQQNITVRGKIEDLFGELVKEYSPWTDQEITTSNSKSYSPNLAEDIYQISFWLENLSCLDQDAHNNQVTKLVAINPQYKETDSSLEIERLYLGSDNEAEWADQFTVKVNIYKGDETRYSVQLWAEKEGEKISKTTKVSLHDPYKHYPLTLPVQLEPNCHQKIEDGTATLVLDGFGLRTEQEFKINDVDGDVCKDYLDYVKELGEKEEEKQKEKNYQIIDLPDSISPGSILRVKVQLLNDNKVHDYQVWSYLYRGSKCYSCLDSAMERDNNKQRATLQKNEAQILEFLLKVDEKVKEGEYKLKVKINKDQQKTNKELTKTVYVKGESSLDLPLTSLAGEQSLTGGLVAKKEPVGKGIVVYESSSQKAQNLLPYLLLLTFGLLCLILILKKK